MKKILLLTPCYFAEDIPIEATAVVNYFAAEWAKMGYDVVVVHLPSLFPWIMRKAVKPFLKKVESKFSATINCETIYKREYKESGVNVLRIPMTKVIPHSKYNKNIIKKTTQSILAYCQKHSFVPDVIVSHFVNPCAEIIENLKKVYPVKSCMVLHSGGGEFMTVYKDEAQSFLNCIDIFGFRCNALKDEFESYYGEAKDWFYCYSGIPENIIKPTEGYRDYTFQDRYIFVGNFRARKHAEQIIDALAVAYSRNEAFTMKYAGAGAGEEIINNKVSQYCIEPAYVNLLGFLSRSEVAEHMRESDVFIMISRDEVFGLVYLEAMAVGTIPIASRNEGFDGIIQDGVNGFLCNAGNAEELASIIKKIRRMSAEELQQISNNAMDTARQMTDYNVAKKYIEKILN